MAKIVKTGTFIAVHNALFLALLDREDEAAVGDAANNKKNRDFKYKKSIVITHSDFQNIICLDSNLTLSSNSFPLRTGQLIVCFMVELFSKK